MLTKMHTRVLTKMYTNMPTKVDVLCVIILEGSHESTHESARGKFDSAHDPKNLLRLCLTSESYFYFQRLLQKNSENTL